MTRRPTDLRIAEWLRTGPETAPPALVEATLRPIPRMRQRGTWRVRLAWLAGPIRRPATVGLTAVLLIGALLAAASFGGGPVRPSAPAGPTFELRVSSSDPEVVIPDTGPYVADPSATTNTCARTPDGFWRMRYSGGEPYVRLDVLVGPEGAGHGRSDDVSFEIVIGSPLSTLINVDQPGYRSGDRPGRSTAIVDTTVGSDRIEFDIEATTPRAEVDFTDYPYTVQVDLTVICPL